MKSIVQVVQNLLKPYIDSNIQTLTNDKVPSWNKRYFLFVGDSYGDESGEWADLIIQHYGLSDRAYKLCSSGSGFYSTNPAYKFITQLETFVGNHTQAEIDNITDIVICGGLNDSFSDNPSAYTNIINAMSDVNTYIRTNLKNVTVSLGYIGNGNDLDPSSLIGTRVYKCRQCCRYVYYNAASLLGWHILHNVEYALTGSPAMIGSDGVHPSTYGSQELANAIGQALFSGGADFNRPIAAISVTNNVGTTITGDFDFKIHNDVCTITGYNLVFNLDANTTMTDGTPKTIATINNMRFNVPVRFNGIARIYPATINGIVDSTYRYIKCRFSFNNNGIMITPSDSDGTALKTYEFPSGGAMVFESFEVVFDSMLLV